MAYTLLFSRNLNSDATVRFTDVPIMDSSIMVDIISLRSQFYRVAGFISPIVFDGVLDYERRPSQLLCYGKTRLDYPTITVPYGIEFFPKWGARSGIISVYSGYPSATPPLHAWVPVSGSGREFKLFTSPAGVRTRLIETQDAEFDAAEGAIEAHIYGNYVYWAMPDGTHFSREIGNWNNLSLVDVQAYGFTRSNSMSTVL